MNKFIATKGRTVGKVCKTKLIEAVLLREHEAGKELEKKRVLLLAQKELEQYPKNQREGVVLTNANYNEAVKLFRRNLFKQKVSTESSNETSSTSTKEPTSLSVQQSFSREELLKAASFLRFCDSSLFKAKELLNFVYALSKEP